MRGKQLTATKMRNIFPSFSGMHGAFQSVHVQIGAIHSVQVHVRILFV